jgi:hypothetical protein
VNPTDIFDVSTAEDVSVFIIGRVVILRTELGTPYSAALDLLS